MKKNVKKLIIFGSAAVGLAAVGGAIAGGVVAVNNAKTTSLNKLDATPAALWSANNGAEEINNSQSVSSSSTSTNVSNSVAHQNQTVTNVDDQFSKFTMSINNADSTSARGSIKFVINGEETTESIQVSPGQTIEFSVKTVDPNDRLGDLRVYASNNPSVSPEIKEISINKYSVTMPPATINGRANPFYSSNEIKVTPIFCKKNINLWDYEFASRSYVLNVKQDNGVFDDKTYNQIKMEGSKDNTRSVQYRIYMNGHDLQIKNITIPSGAQLMFLNNINNTNDKKAIPTVSLAANTWLTEVENADQIDVKGAIGRFSSVNYGTRMKGYFEN